MIRKEFQTDRGAIVYWVNDLLVQAASTRAASAQQTVVQPAASQPVATQLAASQPTLVLLPGLTADHRLFDKQVERFESFYPVLTWDAPGHAQSRPFTLDFDLDDKARWLHEILRLEGVARPVLVGQSMGGYVSQSFMQLFPGEAAGFIAIDSAPLQRGYISGWEIWALKHTEGMYKLYPHKALVRDGAKGCSETGYGRQLMAEFVEDYDHDEYCKLAGHGFGMLAGAYESDRAYPVDCPALLICGDKDKAGSARSYNKKWTTRTGIRLQMIPDAGHNANTDQPDMVNALIEEFVAGLE